MDRKIFFITCGTNGIGFHTAQEIAKEKKTVIITGKNLIKGKKILNIIKDNTDNYDVHYINGDLSSQNEIKNIVKNVKKKFSKIDVLINNVGSAYLKRIEPYLDIPFWDLPTVFWLNTSDFFALSHGDFG